MRRNAITLIEIVVTVTIASIVLAASAGITMRTVDSIRMAKASSATVTALSDAVSRLSVARESFPDVNAVSVPNGYDFVVLTNSGKTAGLLVGVAKVVKDAPDFRLDPVSDSANYGNKVFAVQDLVGSQVAAVLSNSGAAYSLPIREEALYRNLVLREFEATPYNSGTLLDIAVSAYLAPNPVFDGLPKSSVSEPAFPFNIVL